MSVDLTPSQARELARRNELDVPSTSGLCPGYEQANLVVLEQQYAADFELFCRANAAPCPLLYRSQPGQTTAPPLADDSDVRTDLPLYRCFTRGKPAKQVDSLLKEPWQDMVSFYLGCSFGLERALQERGIPLRHVEQKTNVAMFKSNVQCCSVGPFSCPLVVSMRPVPADLLQDAVHASKPLPRSHGSPVHIGHAHWLGIKEENAPDFGHSVQVGQGEVQVFWACGVTPQLALSNAGLDRSYSHSPGSMFICDTQSSVVRPEDYSGDDSSSVYDMQLKDSDCFQPDDVQVVCVSPPRIPVLYSLLSSTAAKKITQLEMLILDDPNRRGVVHLHVPGSLLRAALSLSHCRRVALITGFPCLSDPPHEETDGLPGTIAIARALLGCGVEVSLVCDRDRISLYRLCVEKCVTEGWLQSSVDVLSMAADEDDAQVAKTVSSFDHLVALERASPSRRDGKCRSMTGRDISHVTDPLHRWFIAAQSSSSTMTTGVGDGGNEMGMGLVYDNVVKFIENGEGIASDIAADNLVVAGVSNWGGYAIAAALFILQCCSVHNRYRRRGVGTFLVPGQDILPLEKDEEGLLLYLNSRGIRDGISPSQPLSVDGLPFQPVHAEKLQALRKVALQ